jgi:tetratricopeptide (TPR) repeat protein
MVLVSAIARGHAVCAQSKDDQSAAAPTSRPTVLEEPPKWVKPDPRSEAEQDRLEAQALFAAARKKHETEAAEALRLCQRAYRRDPGRAAILHEILVLGRTLNRASVIDNYAEAALASNPKNPGVLALLSDRFNRRGDFASSAEALEKLIALEQAQDKKTSGHVERIMLAARVHVAAGNYALAAERFAELLHCLDNPREYGLTERDKREILGEAGPTYLVIGEAFLRAGRLKEAEEALQTASRVNRDKPGEAFQMARLHVEARRWDEARKQLQIYFDADAEGQGISPYELLVETYVKEKRPEAGVAELEKLSKAKQDAGKQDPYLTFVLAEQYRKAEKADKAEPLFREVIKIGGKKRQYRAAVVAAQLSLFKLALAEKNAEKLLDVLGWVAGEAGGLAALGEDVQTLFKDKALLGEIAKRAQMRKAELDFGWRLAGALLAMEAKEYKTAGELFDAAIDADPEKTADVVQTWGVSLLRAEQNADAVKVFQRGVDDGLASPEEPSVMHYWLALALESAGKTEEALKVARAGAKLAPADAGMQFRPAWVQYHAKQYAAAKTAYEGLVKKFEADAKLREVPSVRSQLRQARLILSNIAVMQHDLPTAEDWLEQVLDDNPQDTSAQNDLGYLWADQGKHLHRALRMIEKAVQSEPTNAAYLDSLGWVLYRLGDYEAAVVELEKAVKSDDSPDATILDHLGDVYLRANQPAKAREAFERAVKSFDKERDADKIKLTQEKLEKLK